MEQKELWGIGWTRILTGIALIGGIVLMVIGKIPHAISAIEYTGMCAGIIGPYVAKSIGHAVANNRKEKVQ